MIVSSPITPIMPGNERERPDPKQGETSMKHDPIRSKLSALLAAILVLAMGVPSQNAYAAPVTVISNISAMDSSSGRGGTFMATGFTTDPTTTYVATSARLKIYNQASNSLTLSAWLYSDNAGEPGSAVATFTPISIPPSYSSNGEYTITLTAPYQLALNTTYWLVIEHNSLWWENTPQPPTGIFTHVGLKIFAAGWFPWPFPSYFKWALDAEPASPGVGLSTTSLNFGDQPVYTWSPTQTVTVTNTGTADLHIGTITNDGEFFVAPWLDNCSGKTITSSGTCTFDVYFTPNSVGVKTATVSIPSDAASSPDTVSLSGNGIAPELTLSTGSLDFGNQLVNLTSAAQTVTITNTGGADLHIGPLTITGEFALSNNLCDNATLVPAGTCTFGVTFTPLSVGAKTGDVSIPSDSGGQLPQDSETAYFPAMDFVHLSGNGVLTQATLIFSSNGGYDGTIRESPKLDGTANFIDPVDALISVGDDYLKRQYVGILHFDTSGIPDNAVITSAKVRIKGMILSSDTYTRLGELTADITNPYFGNLPGLEFVDFRNPPLAKDIGTFTHAPTFYKWITLNMNAKSLLALNKTGSTQFRLHFNVKMYDDHIKQMVRFLSGDFWGVNDWPKLIVTYYVP
jgi:hypothetical protein